MKKSKIKKGYLLVTLLLIAASMIFQGYMENESTPPLMKVDPGLITSGTINPRAFVSVVQSSQQQASDITYEMIKSMIQEAIDEAGGFYELIDNGDVVVLKPNLISAYDMTSFSSDLPAEVNGMTTDWRVAQAVVEIVREVNPDGKVYILEGVANGTTAGNMSHLNYTEEYITGVDDFIHLEDRSGGWRDWDAAELASVILPLRTGLYPDFKKPNMSPEFYLNRIYYEADVLISMPVLKNHSISSVTGSVKNVGIGATPQNIYGGAPGDNHRFVNDVIDHTPLYLHQWIHDFFLCRPVDYTIMDGLQGSINGPVGITGSNLRAVQQNMRLILAGADAVALDAVACLIMQYDPAKIRHLAYLHNSSAGCADPIAIRVNGISLDLIKTRFTNGINEDIYAWYSDTTPPEFTVNSCTYSNGVLNIDINADEDAVKVEVSVDGNLLNEIGITDFSSLMFEAGDLSGGRHHVSVQVYDKFLNSASQILDIVTNVEADDLGLPESIQLYQNYPNPFNPVTRINYSIPSVRTGHAQSIQLTVFDILGRHVSTLVNEYQPPGTYTVKFDGSGLPSGTYLYTISYGETTLTKSMVLLK